MKNQAILVMDFGGQYNQLIARRVREHHVYAEVLPCTTPLDEIEKAHYSGIIFTGGPASVYAEGAPTCDAGIFTLGIPVLGICYGAQLMAYQLGGKVEPATKREYGLTVLTCNPESQLLKNISYTSNVWMSHTDQIIQMPEGFQKVASSDTCPVAAMENHDKKLYGLQFHPEVTHTVDGSAMLKNFLYDICGCVGDWQMSTFAKESIEKLREKIGDKKVLCALSGGVDSSVCAVMIHKAVGKQLTCIFVDHGLLRKDEGDDVERIFKAQFDMNLIRVNCQERFLNKLAGVDESERKRKIIGEEFIRVFEEESQKLGKVDFLVQGTIYPDVIESGLGNAAVIKSHHNVGGLPEDVDFEIIEPLRELFKDEVRKVGLELGIPETLIYRQPFPGPGLSIRIMGDITKEKLEVLRDADAIVREEIDLNMPRGSVNQYFAVLTGARSVGVMGDERTHDHVVAIRAACTTDFMTAEWARIPYDLLAKISSRIVNEVRHVNRVVYDITTKPSATIEWE